MSGNFKDFQKEAKEHGVSSGNEWFKPGDGESRIRILSEYEIVGKHWDPTFKNGPGKKAGRSFLCVGKERGCPYHTDKTPEDVKKVKVSYFMYVSDKSASIIKDKPAGILKIAELPYTVAKRVSELGDMEDYEFDGFPMPYDIIITKSVVNGKTTYDTIAARSNTPVDAEILEELSLKKPIADIIEKMKENAAPKQDSNQQELDTREVQEEF
jgi:hypothetical protein